MTRVRRVSLLGLVAVLGCGDAKDKAPVANAGMLGNQQAEPVGKEIAPPPLGLESVAAYNYAFGRAEKEWRKAEELAGQKQEDWAAIQAACEATLLKDPGHLEAHYLLARAHVRQGHPGQPVEHLAIALAGDWMRWGPGLAADEDLAGYLASPAGAEVRELNAVLKDAFVQSVRRGLLVVGRRTSFRAPAKSGVQPMATRAELFAFDATTQRWIRVTQTGWRLAGWALAPSGDELAYVALAKVSVPAPPEPGAQVKTEPPIIAEARVGVLNLMAIDQPVKEARLKDLGGAILQYQAGDRLLVTAVELSNGYEESDAKTHLVDPTSGEATETEAAPLEGTRVRVTYEFTETERFDPAGVEADWSASTDAASTFRLSATKKTVSLPRGEGASRTSFVWSPSGTRVAFTTYSDPCAVDAPARQASVYVVDAATGKLKHLFKGEGRFDMRWLGDDQLVYEDDKAGLRVFDSAQGRELARYTNRGGLALDGVGAASGAVCKNAARAFEEEPLGDDSEIGEMPPEDVTH